MISVTPHSCTDPAEGAADPACEGSAGCAVSGTADGRRHEEAEAGTGVCWWVLGYNRL